MNRLSLYVLVFCILTYCASATPLLVVTPPTNIDILLGSTGIFSLNLTNTGDTNLYNLSFTAIDGFSFPQNIQIPKNDSVIINFTVTGKTTTPTSISTTISFYYNSTTIINPLTSQVTINPSGFSTVNKTIYVGDTIVFNNTGNANHSITKSDLTFESILQPNTTLNLPFTNIGTFGYFDRINTGLSMFVNVLSNAVTTPAHDPILDKTVTFNYNLLYTKANITVSNVIPASFSMDYRAIAEGAIHIVANEKIFHMRLYDDWLRFEENDLDIPANSSRIIKFTLRPDIIKSTNSTNITYNRNIRITSTNTDNVSITLPVFIEYHDFNQISSNGTIVQTNYIIVNWTEAVDSCNADPDQYFCHGFPTIYREVSAQVKFNLSEADFMGFLQKTTDNTNGQLRIENDLNEFYGNTNNKFSDYDNKLADFDEQYKNQTGLIQQLIDRQIAFEQKEQEKDNLFYFITGAICIALFMIGLWYYNSYKDLDKYKARLK